MPAGQLFVSISRGGELPPKTSQLPHIADFFAQVLGPRRKYSAYHWTDRTGSLNDAEEDAIAETCRRAGLEEEMRILELGCGWGSISLWAAEHFPGSNVLAVSNSQSQREYKVIRAGLVGTLAHLFHGLRGAVRFRRRGAVVDRSLSVRAAGMTQCA